MNDWQFSVWRVDIPFHVFADCVSTAASAFSGAVQFERRFVTDHALTYRVGSDELGRLGDFCADILEVGADIRFAFERPRPIPPRKPTAEEEAKVQSIEDSTARPTALRELYARINQEAEAQYESQVAETCRVAGAFYGILEELLRRQPDRNGSIAKAFQSMAARRAEAAGAAMPSDGWWSRGPKPSARDDLDVLGGSYLELPVAPTDRAQEIQKGDSVAVAEDRISKRGKRSRYSQDEKDDAVMAWERTDKDWDSQKLQDFLARLFGEKQDTFKPFVALSTFYTWRRDFYRRNPRWTPDKGKPKRKRKPK